MASLCHNATAVPGASRSGQIGKVSPRYCHISLGALEPRKSISEHTWEYRGLVSAHFTSCRAAEISLSEDANEAPVTTGFVCAASTNP